MPELDLNLWLKAEDVEPEATLMFLDEGEKGTIPGGAGKEDTPTFEIGVQLPSGNKRQWTMNMTSQRAVAQAYGVDTKLWIGKPVKVYTAQGNVGGTMRKIIYARVPGK